jgi:hypothetical protein
MTTTSLMPTLRGLVTTPVGRLLGSVISWFGFFVSFTLLARSFVDVASIGGYCASGGSAYVIAHQCPAGATIFVPWVVFTGLISVGIGALASGGFGMPLVAWAWTVLFCVLGAGFLAEGYFAADATGWIIGGLFEVMGLVPFIMSLRASVRRLFIGTANISGRRFTEPASARSSMMLRAPTNPDGAVSPTVVDVLLAVVLPIVASWAGVNVALVWYANVAS